MGVVLSHKEASASLKKTENPLYEIHGVLPKTCRQVANLCVANRPRSESDSSSESESSRKDAPCAGGGEPPKKDEDSSDDEVDPLNIPDHHLYTDDGASSYYSHNIGCEDGGAGQCASSLTGKTISGIKSDSPD
mmetsp:Transcript_133326/g.188353  ORF Transcript_133326/g.188353 Transcript_133326/m.188353 type:complete len:134 (+) Transcript_133326:68-469(+)